MPRTSGDLLANSAVGPHKRNRAASGKKKHRPSAIARPTSFGQVWPALGRGLFGIVRLNYFSHLLTQSHRCRPRPALRHLSQSQQLTLQTPSPPVCELQITPYLLPSMSSVALTRPMLRQSGVVGRMAARRFESNTTAKATETAKETASKVSSTASEYSAKASQGLSRVTSAAGPAITGAAKGVANSLGKIGGRTGKLVAFAEST